MSMSPTLSEQLIQLYTYVKGLHFKKADYENSFQATLKEYRPLLDDIQEACLTAEDQSQMIDEISSVLPEYFHSELNAAKNKREREIIIMNSNTPLVTYVIPLLRYNRNDYAEDLVDELIVKWNKDISMKVQKSTFEDIQAGFKFKLCYITTAVCASLQKPDDCYELTVLRAYRDEYLMASPAGRQLVNAYYDMAPTIVKRINRRTNAKEIYASIYSRWLAPCIQALEEGKKDSCRVMYENMVMTLQETY